MPFKTTVYQVLISAPSDVVQELKAVPEVIGLWNAAHAPGRNVFFEAVHWRTHSFPAGGERPQSILNKQIVANADVLVAVFWTRLGTPTGKHESGTVEEIEEFLKDGKPVLLYFSNQPVIPNSVDPEQYQKVKDFQKQVKDSVLYAEYSSVAEFRELLSQHLTHISHQVEGTAVEPSAAGGSSSEDLIAPLKQFVEHLEALLRRYSIDWAAEKQSQPVNTDDAKWIMKQLSDELLASRSQITDDKTGELTKTLDTAILVGKKVRDHEMFMDGGRSYSEFWILGEEVLSNLQSAIAFLRKEIDRVSAN